MTALCVKFGIPIWRKWADAEVRKRRAVLEKESREGLAASGFVGGAVDEAL